MSGPSGIGGLGAGAGLREIMALRQQIIDKSQVLQTVRTGDTASTSATGAAPPGGSFTGALKSALDQVNQAQSHAETVTTGYETGQVTDIAQVMLARQQSSVAFEATLQVRNKLLSAYSDIMKLGM
ncbi:flagellar hook-basal body complex protein FliE [Novosphingobium sp.]|uniref:flagellar hook-basal body complex protein FliE n=1 Tax=Novosphingobium sp. TaxID=1874826 RepID=UPI003340B687